MILWSGSPSSIIVIIPTTRTSQTHKGGIFSEQNTRMSSGSSSSAIVCGTNP
jgi:hypothetical protein